MLQVKDAVRAEAPTLPGLGQLDAEMAICATDLYFGTEPQSNCPQAITVLKPSSSEEIQSIVNWSRNNAVPLNVFSSSAGPRRRGLTSGEPKVVVDLTNKRRVLSVDPLDAVAIVEPGLGFAELDRQLAPHGLRTFKPLLPRAGKSVLASYLDREPLMVAREHWDILDPLGAAEIVFGTGERFFTGAAGNKGSMEEHWKAGMRYMTATGPVGTDFMRVLQGSQGTLGIVSWAAIFCDRLPAVEKSVLIGSSTLEPILRLASEIHYRRLGHASFISNRRHLAMLATATGSRVNQADLPDWAMFINVAASSDLPHERVAYEIGDITELASREGLRATPELCGLEAQSIMRVSAVLPRDNYKNGLSGGHREVFFLTQTDKVTAFVDLASSLAAQHGSAFEEVAIYLQHRLHGRNCHLEFILPAPPEQAQTSAAFADALAQACCDAGGHFSRPYGNWASMAYARNPSILPYLRHTKAMFDPDRILHPERLGL